MNPHDWFVENRVAFALRVLDASEEQAFADHLGRCEECATAVRELSRDLAWLPMAVAPVVPPPGLAHRALQTALEPAGRRRRWVQPAAAAVALLLALGGWSLGRGQVSELHRELSARNQQLLALQDTLSALFGAERVLQETIARSGHVGGILIFHDEDTRRWNVVVHDVPPAPPGQAYQFWFVTTEGPARGPQLHLAAQRPTFVALPVPTLGAQVVGAELTVEPVGGLTSSRPQGLVLASLVF